MDRETLGDAGTGSPPRVRSRPQVTLGPASAGRITSACAEQTRLMPRARQVFRDHLRVCGADPRLPGHPASSLGSPPRVRSRRPTPRSRWPGLGITSACAEQTSFSEMNFNGSRDHLRVCGADDVNELIRITEAGSPPRVRSRHLGQVFRVYGGGITSACAEQTSVIRGSFIVDRDHLRVCGADRNRITVNTLRKGSPPRVRSRLPRQIQRCWRVRITSACAEQTTAGSRTRTRPRDHLRVCGAD